MMTDTPWLDDAQRLAWVRFAAVLELVEIALFAPRLSGTQVVPHRMGGALPG
jgi:hypothetical protein